jgi:hypothetical protein
MAYIDQNNLTWTRSADGSTMTCQDGRVVIGNADMSDEYLVSVAYQSQAPQKSDAERIAELEAQLAALLAKLST